MPPRRTWLAAAPLLVTCGTAATTARQQAPTSTTAASSSAAALAITSPEPAFAITFAPSFDPPSVGVRVRAKARDGLLRWASSTHAEPAVTARDANGALTTRWKDTVLTIDGAPRGFVELTYALEGHTQGDVVISHGGYVRFYGEPLLLPLDGATQPTHVTIDFDLTRAPVEGVASSFGLGRHVETDVASDALSAGVWMAGAVFTARFDAYEGKDDFAWIGYSAFDARWFSADVATLRTSVSQWFGEAHPPPFTLLLTADRLNAIESAPIAIYPRWHGLFVIADLDAPWSIGPRMSVAMALVSRFIDRIVTAGVLRAGLTRYAAREILLASGAMTPREYADEVNGEIAATLFADKSPKAAEMARVALEASRIDAVLRTSTRGKSTLPLRLRTWIASAHTLTQHDLDDVAPGPVPDDAFGKCLARVPTRFDEFDLGFDEAATRTTMRLAGVHGAAQRAGLRDGEPIVSMRYDEGQAERPVRVTVSRGGSDVDVKYRPTGRTKTAPGWHPIPNVDANSCGH
jgi:hypothetical protein